jgi:predicted CopG family antitoxin
MDEEEYTNKYVNLRILKSIQEYLKEPENKHTAVYPIKIPDDLLYQLLKLKGAQGADDVIHQVFRLGLSIWSEKLYSTVFGSQRNLEDFIELVKKRNKADQ